MAIFGSLATLRAQSPASAAFAIAWTYLDELQRPGSAIQRRVAALTAGQSEKHELGAGVMAIEQAYETKLRRDGFFEAHRKMIDIQFLVSGEETIEVAELPRMTVQQPYDESRDFAVLADIPEPSLIRLRAGEAAVLFPVDAHMPSIRTGGSAVLVRKVVLKVPVSA